MARHYVLSAMMVPIFNALCRSLGVVPTIVPVVEEPPQHATQETDATEEKTSVEIELPTIGPAHDTQAVVAMNPVDTAFVVSEQHKKFRELDFLALRRFDINGNIVQCPEKEISHFRENRRLIVGMITERGSCWKVERHTVMTAVDILDRYMAHNPFWPKDMSYLGMVSLAIASKMEQKRDFNWLLHAVDECSDFQDVDRVPDRKKHMYSMEGYILVALDWKVCEPTYTTFLGLILLDDEKPCVVHLTCFLLELSLFEAGFKKFPPLMICASCILVARKYQGEQDWPPVLRDRTLHKDALGADAVYSAEDLATTTQMVVDMRRSADTTLWVYEKYSKPQCGRVTNVSI